MLSTTHLLSRGQINKAQEFQCFSEVISLSVVRSTSVVKRADLSPANNTCAEPARANFTHLIFIESFPSKSPQFNQSIMVIVKFVDTLTVLAKIKLIS